MDPANKFIGACKNAKSTVTLAGPESEGQCHRL